MTRHPRARNPKAVSTEQRLAELTRATKSPCSAVARETLTQALANDDFPVVAAAAQFIDQTGLPDFTDALEGAMERFLGASAENDKGCMAKMAIANALYHATNGSYRLWLRVVRHVQMEAVWGERIDVAGNLRGVAALALAETGSVEALFEIVRLLVDPEVEARRLAVRALGASRRTDAELLLRLKMLTGDRHAEVLSECLSALMQAAPDRSLEFVAAFLDSPQPAVSEGAALALGESRLPEALDRLIETWEAEPRADKRANLVLALALHRSDEAFAFLIRHAHESREPLRTRIIEALRLCASDEGRQRQLQELQQ